MSNFVEQIEAADFWDHALKQLGDQPLALGLSNGQIVLGQYQPTAGWGSGLLSFRNPENGYLTQVDARTIIAVTYGPKEDQ